MAKKDLAFNLRMDIDKNGMMVPKFDCIVNGKTKSYILLPKFSDGDEVFEIFQTSTAKAKQEHANRLAAKYIRQAEAYTEEMREDDRARGKANWEALSEDEKEAIRTEGKARWDALSEDEKEAVRARGRELNPKWTEEEKQAARDRYAAKSDEEKLADKKRGQDAFYGSLIQL